MNTLTLRAVMGYGEGLDLRDWKKIIKYEVCGLPPGEEAWIADMDHRWQILRAKNGVSGEWAGDYKSAEDALAVLQKEFDGET